MQRQQMLEDEQVVGGRRIARTERTSTTLAKAERDVDRRALGLGWFSLGLGAAQIAAPGGVARMIGVGEDERARRTMRLLGVREIVSGIGILLAPRPAGWLWSRVLGDVMDLALLGKAFERGATRKLAAATAAVAGVTLLDALTAGQLRESGQKPGAVHLRETITVNRPVEEVYRFWRDVENLPRFMAHLESVENRGAGRSRWRAKAPGGAVTWDAEIIEDVPYERISWRSVENADLTNRGTVEFRPAPGGRGCEIHLDMDYRLPVGLLGTQLARLVGHGEVAGDLRRLKQVLETGEVVHSDASIHRGMHAARPDNGGLLQ